MSNTITIDPVTRIEGHSKITIHLDDEGEVSQAQLHITQFRGFEKICEGRPYYEMPSLMARICGICPVSHLVASAKACDDLLAVEVPPTAVNLRRLLNLAQLIQSDALSFFHLASPDFLLGMDSPPEKRNLFGLMSSFPEIARDGIELRKFGQQIIEELGGSRIHPAWVAPGGVNAPLTPEHRNDMISRIPRALEIMKRTLAWFKPLALQFPEEVACFSNFPTLYMGLVTPDGDLEHYDGLLRMSDIETGPVVPDFKPERQEEFIGEAVEDWTYLKFPYFKPMGYPEGIYRVGAMARLHIIRRCGEPLADTELEEYRSHIKETPHSGFHYHYARLVEMLFAIERMVRILNDEDILSPRVRSHADPNRLEGIGVSEAPRGTLMHHYKIDENGLMKWANLIIATGHNNLAMNRGITQAAKQFLHGGKLSEGMLNRIEAVIRAYDPCLSCSTHASGQMSLIVTLRSSSGERLDQLVRE